MKPKLFITDDMTGVAFVVCAKVTTPLQYPDNLLGVCCRCAAAIQFRPHVPKSGPPKLCIDCYWGDVADTGMGDIVITPTTAREVKDFFKKQRH